MTNYEDLIRSCDEDIRSGHPQSAAKRLSQLNTTRVPRGWLLPLAQIARRAGLLKIGLKLLEPIVHPDYENGQPASPSERAEYAVLLMRMGAVHEAVENLKSVDVHLAPEALLYRAYSFFLDWEFQSAVAVLEEYLKTSLSPYRALVGKANLAFALVEIERHDQVLQLTEQIISSCGADHRQLRGNNHALRAQAFIQMGDLAEAKKELGLASQLYSLDRSNDHFLVKKWGLILEGLQTRTLAPFAKLREVAVQNHDWEALREADLFSLQVQYNRELFVHLYFGSPFNGFRERIRTKFNDEPRQWAYVFGPKSASRFDLRTGLISGSKELRCSKKTLQVLQVLCRDFYRPLRIAGLFAQLFPTEHFNVSSSPGRVHQILRRTRDWIRTSHIPIEIAEESEYYSLKINGDFSFRVPFDSTRTESHEVQIQRLSTSCGKAQTFSIKSACDALNVSEATIRRLIKRGIEEQRIERVGRVDRSELFRILPFALRSAA